MAGVAIALLLLVVGAPGIAMGAVPTIFKAGWSAPTPAPTTEDVRDVKFVNTSTGWAVGSNGMIIKTTDGGASWVAQASGVTSALTSVDFFDPDNGWVVGPAVILRTTNGGDTWTRQNVGNVSEYYKVVFADATTGYALCKWGSVFKTIDGGEHWTHSTATQDYQGDIQFIDASTGWLATIGSVNGGIYKTTNGGVSWGQQPTGFVFDVSGVHFINATTGWAVSPSGWIIKTTNGGASWVVQRQGDLKRLVAVDFVDALNGWVVGGDLGDSGGIILRTTDGGATWVPQASGAANPSLCSVDAVNPATAWVAGYGGTLVGTTTGGNPLYGPVGSVFRFFNMRTGTHFYTSNTSEMLSVHTRMGEIFGYEGIAYVVNPANPANSAPLYRFYRASTGTHLYTADASEMARIRDTMGSIYHLDGVAYEVSTTTGTPVYRFYSPAKGVHFYSADPKEIASVRADPASIWKYEGRAYYIAR